MQQIAANKKIRNRYKKYIDLAFEYHVAALSLWTTVLESPYLYNPCMFLIHHTIELLLKGLIYRDCGNVIEVKIESDHRKRAIDNTHDLLALWNYYVQHMQPRLLPTTDDMDKKGTAIKQFAKKDIDSTKYRYPETKKPYSILNLEPIKINNEATVIPELSTTPPVIVSSQSKKVSVITSGAADLKRGYDAFELIETLFQVAEVK